MNPRLTLHMENGAKIVIELLPEAAPNTVNSLIWAASHGWMDRHAIERIVPGNWIDLSYTAFGHKEARYLIPNEFDLHPEIEPLEPQVIERAELELFGETYPEPVRMEKQDPPPTWK